MSKDPPAKKLPGSVWRLLTRSGFAVENEGVIDEVVVDQWMHMEQLEERVWWMRLGLARLIIEIDEEGVAKVSFEPDCYSAATYYPTSDAT
ncbi:MAG: hypothetical protein AB8H86_28945 [Polyangiales bacterium]